jgi:hypothetical protein
VYSNPARASSSQSLRRLVEDEIGRRLLALASDEALSHLAEQLKEEDPYGELPHLEAALTRVGLFGRDAIVAVLRHQLWCAYRESAWRTGRFDVDAMTRSLVLQGTDWARETEGHPTVLIAPMTLALPDASWIVAYAIPALAPGRSVTLYGEDVEAGSVGFAEVDKRMAGSGRAALRNILEALAVGGVFCTYPDFVYEGHEAIEVQLFGSLHPISSAFVSVASLPGTMLLPTLASHGDGEELVCRFFEPIMIADESPPEDVEHRAWRRSNVAQLVASVLEMLIAEAPHQWRLLATLSHDSPQMGRA